MADASLYDLECVVLAALLAACAVAGVLRRLKRGRAGFAVAIAVSVGLAARLAAAAGVSLSGAGLTLRGGDERCFSAGPVRSPRSRFDSGIWLPSENHRLHEIVFALQIKLGDFPDAALRITQIGIAMLGIVLVLAAIHDLAGPRAARIGAWVLALEPAGIFFNSILHREPLLVLASGLVVFGGTKVWAQARSARGSPCSGSGCAIATGDTSIRGMVSHHGRLAADLHASLRQMGSQLRSVPLVYAVAIVVAVATPAVLQLTSQDSLEQNLQGSQDANTSTRRLAGRRQLEQPELGASGLLDPLGPVAEPPAPRTRRRPAPISVADPEHQPTAWRDRDDGRAHGAVFALPIRATQSWARLRRRCADPVSGVRAARRRTRSASATRAPGFGTVPTLCSSALRHLIVLREHALREPSDRDAQARRAGQARTGAGSTRARPSCRMSSVRSDPPPKRRFPLSVEPSGAEPQRDSGRTASTRSGAGT